MSIATNATLALVLMGALSGCSVATGQDSDAMVDAATAPLAPAPGSEEAALSAEAPLSEVAAISIAGSTVKLARVDSGAASPILVSEQFDLSRGSVLQRLTENGPLTSLEIFSSLKPGSVAPAALLDTHAAEASALGRADASVHTVDFDANAPIEKWTSASCDTLVYANEGISPGKVKYSKKQRLDNVSGWNDLYVGTAPLTPIWTTSSVNLGVCNDATTAMTLELWSMKQGQNWGKSWSGTTPAGNGSWWYMIYLGDLAPCNFEPGDMCGAEECICPIIRLPAAYMVRGNGTKFRSRTAEGKIVTSPIH